MKQLKEEHAMVILDLTKSHETQVSAMKIESAALQS